MPNPSPAAAPRSPRLPPQMPPLYVHIYHKTPKHEVYRNSNAGTPPYEQFKEPTAGGRDVIVPPPHFLPPTSPSLACRGGGSPNKGTLQGTAQTQPRGAGGAELGGAEAAQGPPASTDTGDQWGGTGQNKQTNKRQRDEAEQGGFLWPQLPPQARSQPQVSVRGAGSGWDWHG